MSLRQQEENLAFLNSLIWEKEGCCKLSRFIDKQKQKGFILSQDDGINVYLGDASLIETGEIPCNSVRYDTFDQLVQSGWELD